MRIAFEWAVAKEGERCVADHFGLGHAAKAALAALGHFAFHRADEIEAVGLQLGEIALRRRVRPHVRVHGRRHQHRFVGGEQNSGGEIVGEAGGGFGHEVGGGGRDDDEIGLAREADVADIEFLRLIEQIGEDALADECASSERGDEALRRFRHHHAHGDAGFFQAADQLERFVSGDAAANDEQDALAHGVASVVVASSSAGACKSSSGSTMGRGAASGWPGVSIARVGAG
jgi:hypothetical protein